MSESGSSPSDHIDQQTNEKSKPTSRVVGQSSAPPTAFNFIENMPIRSTNLDSSPSASSSSQLDFCTSSLLDQKTNQISQTTAAHQVPPRTVSIRSTKQAASSSASSKSQLDSGAKPTVIGLYGLPGSGKTYLIKQLRNELPMNKFAFFEGSEVISNLVDGGLEAFKQMNDSQKYYWRERAIGSIRKECSVRGNVGIVTGHFLFWGEEEKEAPQPVLTLADWNTYTHIIYLNVDPEVIVNRIKHDKERVRPAVSVMHLRKWQDMESFLLQERSRVESILFSRVPRESMFEQVTRLVYDFTVHNEHLNELQAIAHLERTLLEDRRRTRTMLVIDGDRTLVERDAGNDLWELLTLLPPPQPYANGLDPLKRLFQSKLGYSYTAFRQAALMYEEASTRTDCAAICDSIVDKQKVHSEFVSLLNKAAGSEHVGVIVVTCGPRFTWEKILKKAGLSGKARVLGGGRLSDGYVVTAEVKAALVNHLKEEHDMYVWAFGDSPLDLPMLKAADEAFVVVAREEHRSKTMDEHLSKAIDDGALKARQVSLPPGASPRLDSTRLPILSLTDQDLITNVFRRHTPQSSALTVLHTTTTNAAKLLMTPTRDATISGPALRETHRRIGWYLAIRSVSNLLGLEDYPIPHVQGHQATGYRLLQENRVSIIALMRGGEPMGLGVSDAFPLAMFIHANQPEDIKLHHVRGQQAIILVDSVINSGVSIVKFVAHIRQIHATIQIVVVAGVAQKDAVSKDGVVYELHDENLSVIALRLSENKFTGKGGTDTGNRLFNTTHLA